MYEYGDAGIQIVPQSYDTYMYLIFKLCGFFLFLLGCIAARKAYQFQETL
jgi:hypothetical protein